MRPRVSAVAALVAATALPALVWAAATIGGPLPGPPAPLPARQLVERGRERGAPGPELRGLHRRIGATKQMHPDFGGEAGGGGHLRHPLRGGGRQPAQEGRRLRLPERERRRRPRHEPELPLLPDPRRGHHAAPLDRGRLPRERERRAATATCCIVDKDNKHLYELYALRWTGAASWEAGSGAFFDLTKNDRRPETWTSADAAGLAILPGLVRLRRGLRPGRDRARVPRHGVDATNGYVFPASHDAGDTAGAPPMGTRLRLKAGKDISGYPGAHAEDLPGHEEVRPDRGRQRLRHVRERHLRLAAGTTTC